MARPPLSARPPTDLAEERTLRRLASARHAPASLIQRARIVTASWDGANVAELAQRLGCHPKTVSKWLHRFNAHGLDGLGDLPRPGAPRRLTEHERGRIIALAGSEPPGRLQQGGEGLLAPPSRRRRRAGPWTPWPSALRPRASGWAAARSARSCCARAPAGGVPGRGRPAPTPTSLPKGPRHRLLHRPARAGDRGLRRRARPGDPRSFPPAPGWTPTATGSRPRWTTAAARRRPGSTARCARSTATPSP